MARVKKQNPRNNKRAFARRPKCIFKIIQKLKQMKETERLSKKSVQSKVKSEPNMELNPNNSFYQMVEEFTSQFKKTETPAKRQSNQIHDVDPIVSSMEATDKLKRKTISGPLGDMPVRQKGKGAASKTVKPSSTKQRKQRANSMKQPKQSKSRKSIKTNVSSKAERPAYRKSKRCAKCGVLFIAN